MERILILGGTTEARLLAARLAGHSELAVTLSLAGRTAAPAPQAVETRMGGFGGVAGLAGYLRNAHIAMLVDATHPFAANISANAVQVAAEASVPLLRLERPPWSALKDDRWTEVETVARAAGALGERPRNVLLAIGRQEVASFVSHPQHRYTIRSIDPVDSAQMPPNATVIHARGPFDLASETALLRNHSIDVVVAKNSGGDATYAKLEAARRMEIDVIMVRRPPPSGALCVADVDAVVGWIDAHCAAIADRGA